MGKQGSRSALASIVGLFVLSLSLSLCLYAAGWIYRIRVRQYYIWLPDYARWSLRATEHAAKPVHVISHLLMLSSLAGMPI
jgi:hypothetical protein